MARSPILPKKLDLVQHKYRLLSNGKTVAEFKTLKTASTGSQKQKIQLEQVKIKDATFGNWIKTAASKLTRKNLAIQEFDAAGKLLSTYRVSGCWVSEFSALPELDAGANAVIIETLSLETEGWERDDNPP
jgi:phage tail-like protein